MVEARHPDGSLNVKGETPFLFVTENQLFDYFFSQHNEAKHASWEELRKFFAEHGWYIREKTW